MHRNPSRPLSPHLTAWRWGPHMIVSILHRMTGMALTVAGGIALAWWLYALARGPKAYAAFADCAGTWYALVIWIGLSWTLLQHFFSGLRHLVMDLGAGFEIRRNKVWALLTMVASTALTALLWFYILAVR